MTQTIETTICVLGGGPAGSILARGLAQLGYQTILIDRGVRNDTPRAESLAPPAQAILQSLGLGDVADRTVLRRETHALVRWASDTAEIKPFDPPSLLVERSRFDDRVREAATIAGVHLMTGNAGVPSRLPGGGWLVPVRSSEDRKSIASTFLVDARGRRRGRRSNDTPTAAVRGTWKTADASLVQTIIDTGTDEWLWGSPCGEGRYATTLFVDTARLAGLTNDRRRRLYLRLLAQSELLRPLLEGELTGPLCVRDATATIAETLISPDLIRVGDAAFAIDPLSSQGIQAAMLSAIQGTAAVHTMLLGGQRGPAMEFYRTHQTRAAARAARNAASHYRIKASDATSAFWARRAVGSDLPTPHPTHPHPARLPFRVGLSPSLQIVNVPVLSGSLITLAPALSHPGLDEPVGYLGGIALAPLVARLTTPSSTDEIVADWTARMRPEAARAILRWMCRSGILIAHA